MPFRTFTSTLTCVVAASSPLPAFAEDVPATTVLHARLRQTVSSFASKGDDPVSATLIAPIEIDGKTLLPLGSTSDPNAASFVPGRLTLHGPLRYRQFSGGIGIAS